MTDLERMVKTLIDALIARDPLGVHRPISVGDLRKLILPYRTFRTALGLTGYEDYELLILRLVAEEGEFVRTNPAAAAERARKEVESPNPDLDLVEELADATIQIGAPTLARIEALAEERPRIEPTRGLPLILIPEPKLPEAEDDAEPEPTIEPVSAPPPEPIAPLASPSPSEADRRWAPPVPEPAPLAPAMPAPPVPQPAPPIPEPIDIPQFDALEGGAGQRAGGLGRGQPDRCLGCEQLLPVGREVVFCPYCGQRVGTQRCLKCGTELEADWRHCITCGAATGPKPVA